VTTPSHITVVHTLVLSVMVFTSLLTIVSNSRHFPFWVPELSLCFSHRSSQLTISSQSQSQSYITTDNQSASLPWCHAPIWDIVWSIFLHLSLIIFRWCGAHSLTRGRVCSFQFLLGITSAVFLSLSTARLVNISFLSFREWEKRKESWGGCSEGHYFGVGLRNQYIRFRRFPDNVL
jgi:hypothetical protein